MRWREQRAAFDASVDEGSACTKKQQQSYYIPHNSNKWRDAALSNPKYVVSRNLPHGEGGEVWHIIILITTLPIYWHLTQYTKLVLAEMFHKAQMDCSDFETHNCLCYIDWVPRWIYLVFCFHWNSQKCSNPMLKERVFPIVNEELAMQRKIK